jgi:hypothetical protein
MFVGVGVSWVQDLYLAIHFQLIWSCKGLLSEMEKVIGK